MLDLIRVDNVCSIKRGSQLKSSEAVRGKYPVVAGGILPSCFHNQFNRKGPVITISASGANAGYINYYNQNIFATDCSTIEESNNYDLKYLYYSLKLQQKKLYSMQTGGAQPHIHPKEISQLEILNINKNEQIAISKYLTDIDEYVFGLEKLILKKKLIKQGVMKELLAGKKRLSGFNKEWKKMKLGDACKIYQPETIRDKELLDYGYLVYGANGIIGHYNRYNHKEWQVTITCRGSTCGTVNKTVNKCWITGNAMVIGVDNSKFIDKLFLYYYLSSLNFNNCITGSGQPQIVRKPLVNYEIFVPDCINEQKEIAKILFNIDEEINSLEQDLEKYKQIKQGMMEQLLTGKIRLVEESDNVQTLPEKKHNQHFDDAVVFANIVASCYDPAYPLGRKKCQKMMYLFKRFNECSVDQFKHYAAGPYDSKARYGGFETIAIKNKYVVENKSAKGSSFAPGPEIEKAKAYCSKYGYDEFIPIFNQYLKYKKVDELELYTTVDKTILEKTK